MQVTWRLVKHLSATKFSKVSSLPNWLRKVTIEPTFENVCKVDSNFDDYSPCFFCKIQKNVRTEFTTWNADWTHVWDVRFRLCCKRVSFAKEPYKRDYILQKRPAIVICTDNVTLVDLLGQKRACTHKICYGVATVSRILKNLGLV